MAKRKNIAIILVVVYWYAYGFAKLYCNTVCTTETKYSKHILVIGIPTI